MESKAQTVGAAKVRKDEAPGISAPQHPIREEGHRHPDNRGPHRHKDEDGENVEAGTLPDVSLPVLVIQVLLLPPVVGPEVRLAIAPQLFLFSPLPLLVQIKIIAFTCSADERDSGPKAQVWPSSKKVGSRRRNRTEPPIWHEFDANHWRRQQQES
eukprot:EG_transcript_29470